MPVLTRKSSGRVVVVSQDTILNVIDNRPAVEVVDHGAVVGAIVERVTTVTATARGPQGIQGLQGVPGTGVENVVSRTSADTLALDFAAPVYERPDATILRAFPVLTGNAYRVLGVVRPDAGILAGATGAVLVEGPLTGTQAQWEAATGVLGPLVIGAPYFLGGNGRLTPFAPMTEQALVRVGRAIAGDTLLVALEPPILL